MAKVFYFFFIFTPSLMVKTIMTSKPICIRGARAFRMDLRTTWRPENKCSSPLQISLEYWKWLTVLTWHSWHKLEWSKHSDRPGCLFNETVLEEKQNVTYMMMTSNFFHPRTKTSQKLQKLPFTRVMAGQTWISVMKSLSLWKEVAVHLFSKHETFCEESQSWQLSVFQIISDFLVRL